MSSKTIASHLKYPKHIFPEPIIADKELDKDNWHTTTFKNNFTLLPNRLLATLTPIFTIRHPVIQMTSYMRAAGPEISMGVSAFDEDVPVETSFKWTRLIFDAYKDTYNATPIVVDADDLIRDTQSKMKTICDRLGLDESMVKYEWEPKDCPPWGEGSKLFMEKARKSTGVMKDDVRIFWYSKIVYSFKILRRVCLRLQIWKKQRRVGKRRMEKRKRAG
jgi:hypothetical protein